MVRLVIAAALGVLIAVGSALAVVSSQEPEDITAAESVLDSYGLR